MYIIKYYYVSGETSCDTWSYINLFTDSEEKAKQYCIDNNEIIRKQIIVHELWWRYRNSCYHIYKHGIVESRKSIPKWKSGIRMDEISVEMRDERNSILKHNLEVSHLNNALDSIKDKVIEVKFLEQIKTFLDLTKKQFEESMHCSEYTSIKYSYEKSNEI